MAKEVALSLLKILEEHTDRTHMLSKKELLDILLSDYGIDIEEKSFYRKIKEIEDAGYHVRHTKGAQTKYCLDEARLSEDELCYLLAMIGGSGSLSEREAADLSEKLLSMRVHKRAAEKLNGIVTVRCGNHRLRQIQKFGVLSRAIRGGGRVECKFLSDDGTLSPRKIIRPRELSYEQSGFMLLYGEEDGSGGRIPITALIDVMPVEKNRKK